VEDATSKDATSKDARRDQEEIAAMAEADNFTTDPILLVAKVRDMKVAV